MGFIGHSWELIIIFVIALLIFGPKKLPEMGSAIGKSIKEFQKGMKEITNPKEEEPATTLERTKTESRPVEQHTVESVPVDKSTVE
jgi:sec-independent protein translocase protein TatA